MSKTTFKKGQTVVVLGPPEDWDNDILYWNNKMAEYIGKTFTIKDVMRQGKHIRLNIGEDTYPWVWHKDWISTMVEYTLF